MIERCEKVIPDNLNILKNFSVQFNQNLMVKVLMQHTVLSTMSAMKNIVCTGMKNIVAQQR